MKYLNSTFTVESPESTNGLTCPRCVFGEKWGEHVAGCAKRPRVRIRKYRTVGKTKEMARDLVITRDLIEADREFMERMNEVYPR